LETILERQESKIEKWGTVDAVRLPVGFDEGLDKDEITITKLINENGEPEIRITNKPKSNPVFVSDAIVHNAMEDMLKQHETIIKRLVDR
jgi:hypothetical protein